MMYKYLIFFSLFLFSFLLFSPAYNPVHAGETPGPRPAPPTPNGITVPSTIDKTGATDVTALLQSWIDSQPDGTAANPTILIFPVGATYRMNAWLYIVHRKYITFWGYGSTLRPMGSGATLAHSAFLLEGSKFIKILGFRIRGANEAAGTPDAYTPNFEYSMGVALFDGSNDVEIVDNWISHTFGDAIYIDPGPAATDRVNIHHNLLELTGRHGIVVDAGADNRIEWNIIRDTAFVIIDAEDARGGLVSLGPLYIRNNLFDRWMHSGTPADYWPCHALGEAYPVGYLSSMHDIYIEDNTFQGGCVGPGNTFAQSTTDGDIWLWGEMPKSNIFIRNNTFNLPSNQRTGVGIKLNQVTGGQVCGNIIPGQTVQCQNCTNVTFPNDCPIPTSTSASTPTPGKHNIFAFNDLIPDFRKSDSFTADLDGNKRVDIFDYNTLVSDFGKSGTPGFVPADINKDGKVDILDYNILIGNFGK